MSDKVYKLLIGLCVVIALVGCAGIGYGLKKRHDAAQLEATKRRAQEVVTMVQNATVFLMGQNEKGESNGTGTGFVIKTDSQGSWIVTNKHVCMMSRLSIAEVRKEEGIFTFRPLVAVSRYNGTSGVLVVKVAQNVDLCLVRTEQKFAKPLKLAKEIKKGDSMFTFGFPSGKPELNFGKYLGTFGNPLGFYSSTDLKIWYGASGSPAVNMNGEVIGVMSNIRLKYAEGKKKAEKREDVMESLFIPLETLREFIGGL